MCKLFLGSTQRRSWVNCNTVFGIILIVLLLGQFAKAEGIQVSTQCRLQWSPSLESEITGHRVYLGRAQNQIFSTQRSTEAKVRDYLPGNGSR